LVDKAKSEVVLVSIQALHNLIEFCEVGRGASKSGFCQIRLVCFVGGEIWFLLSINIIRHYSLGMLYEIYLE
jgi:hypothetical protein